MEEKEKAMVRVCQYSLVWATSGIIDDSIILATTEVLLLNLNFQSLCYVIQLLGHECNAMHRI